MEYRGRGGEGAQGKRDNTGTGQLGLAAFIAVGTPGLTLSWPYPQYPSYASIPWEFSLWPQECPSREGQPTAAQDPQTQLLGRNSWAVTSPARHP